MGKGFVKVPVYTFSWGCIMLRSVDMQQILLQTSVVEKIQQVEQQHADIEKKQIALQLQKEIDNKRKEVQNTKESEQVAIHEKDKREQQQKRNAHAKGDEENTQRPHKKSVEEIDQGKILDLII